MKNMKVLYIGDNSPSSTSHHRSETLKRIGCDVTISDPYKAFSIEIEHFLIGVINYHFGYRLLQPSINKWVNNLLSIHSNLQPDFIWVNSGELFGSYAINKLRQFNCPVLLYINDDPIGSRDGHRFDSLIKSIPYYDLCIVRREENVSEFIERNAKKVLKVWMSYDEITHKAMENVNLIPLNFRSEVAFIGTWMRNENRDEFLLYLINRGLNIAVWGNRWNKSPHWAKLKRNWRGAALSGQEYVMAIQGAKICIGLLSKGNRDLHTRRSMEIPYAGGVLCAERTSEHLDLYEENNEAIFWDNKVECADKCIELINNPEKLNSIRIAGMKRVLQNKVGNEDICRQIISTISL